MPICFSVIIEKQILEKRKALEEIQTREHGLQKQLFDNKNREEPGFMDWLRKGVSDVQNDRQRVQDELKRLERAEEEIKDKSGLNSTLKVLSDFIKDFDHFSNVQKRDAIEKLFKAIIIKDGNKAELQIYGEPPVGVRRKKGLDSEMNGRADWIRTSDPLHPMQVR